MTLKVVVLPAPFGPITPTICRWRNLERNVSQRMDAAEHLGDAGRA